MNPFRGKNHTVVEMSRLYGRNWDVNALWNSIEEGNDVLLLGPEGVGKSSLLQCAMSTEYRRRMAQERGILITRPFDYPVKLENEKVFPFLVDQVTLSLSILPESDEERISQRISREKNRFSDSQELFTSVVNMMYDREQYRIVLVIDNFERFTSSPEVTMDQHETMRDLLEKGYLRFVVATNYDLSKDSLPQGIKGSYLLQKFMGSEQKVSGISMDHAYDMLTRMGGMEMDSLSDRLWEMTGGIPGLLIRAAGEACDLMETTPAKEWKEEHWGRVTDRVYEAGKLTLKHWCGMMTEPLVATLKEILEKKGVCQDVGRAGMLVNRGLIREARSGGGRYEFVNALLERYVREGNVEPTDMNPPAPQAIPAATNEQVLKEVVRQLLDSYNLRALSEPAQTAEAIEEPIQPSVKEVSVTAEEQQTIESIFDSYRSNYPTEMTDELMADLGDFCLKELQQALVFEAVDGTHLGDTRRAALNAYGVALERRLGDCLYDLFSTHAGFAVLGAKGFGTANRSDASIGSYCYIVTRSISQLACCSSECGMPEYNYNWWHELSVDLAQARDVRNLADHPELITNEAVPNMHEILLGSCALMKKLAVGRELFEKACGGVREASREGQMKLSGTTVEFECREVTVNKSLKGVLRPYGFAASISAKKTANNLGKLMLQNGLDDLASGKYFFDVIVDSYDSGSRQFLATPASAARKK